MNKFVNKILDNISNDKLKDLFKNNTIDDRNKSKLSTLLFLLKYYNINLSDEFIISNWDNFLKFHKKDYSYSSFSIITDGYMYGRLKLPQILIKDIISRRKSGNVDSILSTQDIDFNNILKYYNKLDPSYLFKYQKSIIENDNLDNIKDFVNWRSIGANQKLTKELIIKYKGYLSLYDIITNVRIGFNPKINIKELFDIFDYNFLNTIGTNNNLKRLICSNFKLSEDLIYKYLNFFSNKLICETQLLSEDFIIDNKEFFFKEKRYLLKHQWISEKLLRLILKFSFDEKSVLDFYKKENIYLKYLNKDNLLVTYKVDNLVKYNDNLTSIKGNIMYSYKELYDRIKIAHSNQTPLIIEKVIVDKKDLICPEHFINYTLINKKIIGLSLDNDNKFNQFKNNLFNY